jgi:methylase of polypeptide subunit release factors
MVVAIVHLRTKNPRAREPVPLISATDTVFAGSIPATYDRYMVPLLFRPYAELVAQRVKAFAPQRILEIAAGTGVVTEALHKAVPDAQIVATDLNPPMLEQAAQRVSAANVLCGWLPHCKRRFDVLMFGRVQSCVRPVDAVFFMTAGPDGVREPGPTLLCRLLEPSTLGGVSRLPV